LTSPERLPGRPALRDPVAGIAAGVLVGLLVGVAWSARKDVAAQSGGQESSERVVEGPRYTRDGALLRPEGFERWMLAGASLGLGYGDSPEESAGPGRFHNVYIEPGAYAAFTETGAFPQGTMLAMAVYDPEERIPPQRWGYVEGVLTGLEVAVKDSSRFEDGWAYFGFARNPSGDAVGAGDVEGDGLPAREVGDEGRFAASARAFPPSACAACHREHAALDNVFTQFYPLLREGGKP
jgi:hypothetical protein